MQLTIIGSGTALPQRTRSAPCCLIGHGNENIVVDLGSGSTRGILVHGSVTVREVGLILITHLHPDHCSDLPAFLFALRSREMARGRELKILGPKGLRSHFNALRDLWGHRVEPMDYELVIDEWIGEGVSWGPFRITAARTDHPEPNLAWMIKIPGRDGILVTGDGAPTGEVVELGRSSRHVLLAECSLAAGQTGVGHMNPGQAGELARRCRSRKLILTHLNPGFQPGPAVMEAGNQFDGEVVVAEDGMKIEVG